MAKETRQFWSNRIQRIIPYTPGEQPIGQTFIKLNTNESPYPPSSLAVEAIRAAAGDCLRRYPDPEAMSLRAALAAYHDVKPEEVFVGNGSDEVLAFAFQAFFNPETPILFADITYSFYKVYAALFGLCYREIPLDNCFQLPIAPFLDDNGGVVLCNPNAPTGREISQRDIREIVEANPNVVVLVDEAYVDFGALTALDLVHQYPNLLVIRTFSKSRSLAGLRVGYAVGDANLIAGLNCVKNSFNSYTLDRLALAGAEASVRDPNYFHATMAKIMNTRDWVADRLRGMGFAVCDSATNFLFLSHDRVPAKTLLAGLRARGVLVRWWDSPRISNHLRITVGTDAEMTALCAALAELLPPDCLEEKTRTL